MDASLLRARRVIAPLTVSSFFLVASHASAGSGERGVLGPVGLDAPEVPAVLVEPEDTMHPVTMTNQFAGSTVAIRGNVALIGVPGAAMGAAGRVFAFRRIGRAWADMHEELEMNPGSGVVDNFGASIAWAGNLVVIGAPNAPPANAGMAYLFAYDETAPIGARFTRVAGSLPRPSGGPTRFGASVAATEDWIVVGAPDSGTSLNPGAAYVYAAPFTAMAEALPGAPSEVDDLFGTSVAVAGDSILVGAPRFDASAAGDEGVVFAYERSGTTWADPVQLTRADTGTARFGEALAFSADGLRALVGAPYDSIGAPSNAGAAYLFERTTAGAAWMSTGTRIGASDAAASDYFGTSVAISGTDLVIGAPEDDEPGMTMTETGSAYLFRGTPPVEIARLHAGSTRANRDRLGTAVAVDSDTVLVGATMRAAAVAQATGYVASFEMPRATGSMCSIPGQCESGFCTTISGGTSVCCESACDGACQECTGTGTCGARNEGGSCTPVGCATSGMCSSGVCVADCPDTPMPDTGVIGPGEDGGVDPDFDGGRRTRRVSGCKCAVGSASATPGTLVLVLLVASVLVVRRARRVLPAAAVLLVLLSSAGVVHAQDGSTPPPDDETQALLVEALREYDTGNYEEAYALFLRVHNVRPSARTERALGNAAFELRRYRQAVEWLELALADDRNPLTDAMRSEVEGVLRRARAFLGTFVVVTNVEGARISVDGHPIEGDTATLDLGEHVIEATADGHSSATRSVTVHGGEEETISLTLERDPEHGGPITVRPDPGGTIRDVGWAGVVAGGVLVLGGVVSIAIWADTVGTLNANLADPRLCQADFETENVIPGEGSAAATCLDQQNRYRLALPFAYVGFIGGAVFLGLGLGLVFGAPSAPADDADAATSLRVSCGPFAEAGIMCGGSF